MNKLWGILLFILMVCIILFILIGCFAIYTTIMKVM